jgi:multimeric flavodoxin WrbA
MPVSPEPKKLLIIHGGHAGGRTYAMVEAVRVGVLDCEDAVELRVMPALQAGLEDLLWCQGLLIGTPEHFGYMSGAVKDFFDRTFYPAQARTEGLPYGLFISAGNDGSGTARAVERIVLGYRWRAICEPLIVVGDVTEAARASCHELGQTMAAGLSLGVL